MNEALARAYAGGGPTVIEAVTYRLADHTTADDASRYRPPEEVADAWKKANEENLLKQCNEQVQAAAQAYLDTPPPPLEQMFDHLYATLPSAFLAQRAAMLGTGHGPDHAR